MGRRGRLGRRLRAWLPPKDERRGEERMRDETPRREASSTLVTHCCVDQVDAQKPEEQLEPQGEEQG